MKDCPVKGCTTRIAAELLMCSFHYQRIPQNIKARLSRDSRAREEAITALNAQWKGVTS